MQERDLMEESVADVLQRFLEGQTDAEDEELARRAPRLYRTFTKMTVRQAEALLARDRRWARKYRIPHLEERLVGSRPGHVTEKELEDDLREGRYRVALVFSRAAVERWVWKAAPVEFGDPADAYEPPRRGRGEVKKEIVFTVPRASRGHEEPRREALAADRLAVALSAASVSAPLRLLWVHGSAMDRASAENLAPTGRRAGSRRRRPGSRKGRR